MAASNGQIELNTNVHLSLPLPQIQADIMREAIASGQTGIGIQSISSLVLTAPAGGTASYTNTVNPNDVWVLLAPMGLNATNYDSELSVHATVDLPTKYIVPPYTLMQAREFKSLELQSIQKSLILGVVNGTDSPAQVNFVVEYAVVVKTWYIDTLQRIMRLGIKTYTALAEAAKKQGLTS